MKVLVKYLLISILCLGICTPVSAQEAEKLFQQGMMKEEAEGNLEEAIDLYNKVVSDVSAKRSLRANALMHVGICYEKLGKGNALNAYRKIISEYSDQVDIVSLARRKVQSFKISDSKVTQTGLISQQIEKGISHDIWPGKFSPDGKYYWYLNRENNTTVIMTYDMVTKKRDSVTTGNVTKYGVDTSVPWDATWSPDGKKIAYVWGFWPEILLAQVDKASIYEIHLVDRNGKNKQVILSGKRGEIPGIEVFTPDGKNLLGTLWVKENNQKSQQLVSISIADKNFITLKNFGTRQAGAFSYSPDGNFLLYAKTQSSSKNNDIYIMSMIDMKETQITSNISDDWNPLWSPNGNQILFCSNRMSSKDLFKISFKNGKVEGSPEIVKRNLGDNPKMMGVTKDGSVYYTIENSRNDVYTLNLDEKFNNNINKITQITNPELKTGGGLAKYSKDGRYISYLINPDFIKLKNEEVDLNLGRKYNINIYDTKTSQSKRLNLDLYENHKLFQYMYHVPSWSYHEDKLLVHGRIKDNYEGGFFMVDIHTEEITPVLTIPNCKAGTEYKKFGNSMVFSKNNKDIIYYSSPDWKYLMKYNMATKEEKSIVHIEDGFWFEGFLDEAETKCIAINRFGKFISNINTKKTQKVAEKEIGWSLGFSKDRKYVYYASIIGKREVVTRTSVYGIEPNREIYLDEVFPNSSINRMVMDLHPEGNEILIGVNQNSGKEIYKLSNIFN